jgi:organic hydroperoxide reductase OsmC/OhrA
MDNVFTYITKIKWEKDRIGSLSAPGLPVIEGATPPEFPGGVEGYWSPEHLFVASANICLMTTFLTIAANSKFEFLEYTSEAEGKLEKVDGKFMISEITLKPVLKVNSESQIEKGIRLIEKAEHNCLISNSMKSKIILSPQVTI